MELSNDLLSKFAKVVKDDKKPNNESIAYGTAVLYNGKMYARLDGSDRLTPIKTTTAVKEGDRVTVLIKNHSALITGNISSPSVNKDDMAGVTGQVEQLGNQIKQFDTVIANKVDVKDFTAEVGRIDSLVAQDVVIKNDLSAANATIETLKAKDLEVTGKLTAVDADIKKLTAEKIDATAADLKYATITNLEATNATIHNLNVDYGDFKNLTTEKLTATDAEIKRLDAEKLKVTDADIKYATIDFANIGEAAVKKIFADSGIIKDLIVSGGHITGELVGVTIKGDLIEGGTVKADKLVVKGTDGIYYKLNVTGEQVEALQTNENSLNGSIITAKSITATKIAVDDLVAFNATIGGFNLTNSAIYSGVKSSATNTTRGVYLDREGQLSVGDSVNFLRYYKDQNGKYKLELSASSITMGTSNKDLETALGETMSSSVEEFYQSSSPTRLIGGSWSRVQPTWVDGKYIWRRNIVTYANGTITYTPSETGVCISGNTGSQGNSVENVVSFYKVSPDKTGIFAPQDIGGRNLILQFSNASKNGITVERTNDGIRIHGTNTEKNAAYGVGFFRHPDESILQASCKYVISTTKPLPDGVYIGLNTSRQSDGLDSGAFSEGYLYGDGATDVKTLTASSDTSGSLHGFIGILTSCGTVDITLNIKLEKGPVATAWTPAPEDLGWSTLVPELSPTNKYLWNYDMSEGSNGMVISYTAPRVIGVYGDSGQDAITLQILSSNGNLFKNSSLSTTLTVTIIIGSQMITSAAEMRAKFGPQSKIEWEQKRFGEATFTKIDPTDPRLSDDGFILTLTTTDVYTHTVFNCGLNY